MIYIIGGHGFVGSAFARLFAALKIEHRVIGRDDMPGVRGTTCDILINANGNSKKYLAEREPLADFDLSVRSVAETIETIRCKTYVYLSTGDVYPEQTDPSVTQESQTIDPARLSRYGLHKLMAETLVRGTQRHWLIVRMGGMVGPGLRKNAIYDMLAGDPVRLSPQSELQYIATDSSARLVWSLIERGITGNIVNIGARGRVNLGDLHRRINSASPFADGAPLVRYELSLDKLAGLIGAPLPESQREVDAFLTGRAAAPKPGGVS